MFKYFILAIFCCTAFQAQAQVKLITPAQLENRIAAGKDTTYVINFWATWCKPCVAELPSFERLNTINEKAKLKVILVSVDFKSKLKSYVQPFVDKNKIESEVFLIDAPDKELFYATIDKNWGGAIPATLFINRDEKVRIFHERSFQTYQELEQKLASLNLKSK